MGIKQMGLTVGGFVAALVLPAIAAALEWRAAIIICSAVVALPAVLTWWTLAPLGSGAPPASSGEATAVTGSSSWGRLGRPAIVVGLLVGPAVFGLLLVRWDSYAVPWAVFAAQAAVVTTATVVAGPAIDREREPA